jgi:hypothetical protein
VRENGAVQDDASAIRPRRESDLAACADLVREVHAADRYPRYLPRDIGTFLAPPDPYGCWVADAGGAVVGHVALVARGLPATSPAERVLTEYVYLGPGAGRGAAPGTTRR